MTEDKKGRERPDDKAAKKRPEGIMVLKGSDEKADAALRDGGIDVIFFIESHGNDQQAVADGLKNTLINDFKNERGVTLRKMSFHPVIEKEKFYSGFVECDFVARDPQLLMYLALRYGPSAVEVLKPDNINITGSEFQGMLADASASVQVLIGRTLELMHPEVKNQVFKDKLGLKK